MGRKPQAIRSLNRAGIAGGRAGKLVKTRAAARMGEHLDLPSRPRQTVAGLFIAE